MQVGDPSFISGFFSEARGYVLRGGSVIGLEHGSQLEIYLSNAPNGKNLHSGTLVVEEVEPFRSFLTFPLGSPKFTIPSIFFAKATAIPFDIFTEVRFRKDMEKILSNFLPLERAAIHLHEQPQNADIKLEISGNQLIFHRCSEVDQEVNDILGTTKIPYSLSVNSFELISRAFKAIAHFNRQLRISPPKEVANTASLPTKPAEPVTYYNFISRSLGAAVRFSSRGWKNSSRSGDPISLQFFEVETIRSGFDYRFKKKGGNLIRGDTVDLIVDDDKKTSYGVTIHNHVKAKDLYAYLFYFDASTFVIGMILISLKYRLNPIIPPDCWYSPNDGEQQEGHFVEAPLKAGSDLGIGIGTTGQLPRKFSFDGNADTELGYCYAPPLIFSFSFFSFLPTMHACS